MQSQSPAPSPDSDQAKPAQKSLPRFMWAIWLAPIILSGIGIVLLFLSVSQTSNQTLWIASIVLLCTGLVISGFAIQRSRAALNTQPETDVDKLSALNRLSRRLALADDLHESYVTTQTELFHLVKASKILTIYSFDDSQTNLSLVYETDGETVTQQAKAPMPLRLNIITQWINDFNKPLLIQNNTFSALPNEIQPLAKSITGSWLGVPLHIGQTKVGILIITNPHQENAFQLEDVDLVATAAITLAITIQNQQLLTRTRSALQKQAQQRIQLQTAIDVSGQLGGVLNPTQLMQQTIDLIQERFELYYVGFFLLDEDNRYAVLQAGTGEAGREQLNNNHRHAVNGRSLIGSATGDGLARVLQDVRFSENWFANPLLPDTRSEIALPLRARGRILGALTAQSIEVNKFLPELVQILQSMCDQIAVALDNANLFSQLESNIEKIDSLYQAERQLVEASSKESIYEALIRYTALSDLFDGIRVIAPNEQAHSSRSIGRYWIHRTLTDQYGKKDIFLENDSTFYNLPTTEFVRIDDITSLNLPRDHSLHHYEMKSLLVIPIHLGQRWFGSLVAACQTDLPSNKSLQSLRTLMDQAAIILSNQNLLNETSTLYTLSRNLNESLTQNDMAQVTAEKLAAYTGAKQVRILFHDRSLNLTKIANSHTKEIVELERNAILEDPVYDRFRKSDTEFVVVDEQDENKELSPIVARYLRPYDVQATLFVPAISQYDLIGFIMLDSSEMHWPFTKSSINFTRTAADQFAVTNENFILFNQTLNRARDLITLNQIGANIASTLDAEKLAQIVYNESKRLLQFDSFILARYDHEVLEYQAEFIALNDEILAPSSGTVSSLVHAHLIRNESQIYHQNNPFVEHLTSSLALNDQLSITSLIVTPLHTEEHPIGFILYMRSGQESFESFNEDESQLAQAIANQTTLSLVNTDLLTETRNTVAELRTLFNVTQSLASSVEADSRLASTLQTLHLTLQEPTIALIFYDRRSQIHSIMASYGNPYELPPAREWEDSLQAKTLNSDDPILVDQQGNVVTQDDGRTRFSEVLFPLQLAKEPIGVLHVIHDQGHSFDSRDLRLLQTISVSLAATLENGRLFQQIQDANVRLLELDRMKTQFLANMSHELRTPLNSIIGFSRLILKGIDGPINDTQREDLNSIYHSGQHLLSLINDILDLAKLDSGKMALVFTEVNLAQLADSLLSTARGLMREKTQVELRWHIPEDLPTIEADGIRLRQVLLNLVSNSIKFTEKGHISMSIYQPEQAPDFIQISVEDTGMGIDARDFPRLFRKFEQIDTTTTRQAEGTGLGLPIVQELTQLHHGRVWVESVLGKGSVFHVLIPISQEKYRSASYQPGDLNIMPAQITTTANAATNSLAPVISDKIKPIKNGIPAILLVDDEPGILSLYERYLNTLPNPIIAADSGKKALNALEQHPNIGLILLDIHMPDLNGWQVLDAIRENPQFAKIPVVICSVDSNEQDAKRRGAQLSLPKPIISNDLARVIKLLPDVSAKSSP